MAEEPASPQPIEEHSEIVRLDLEPAQEPSQVIHQETRTESTAPAPRISKERFLAICAALVALLSVLAVFLGPSTPISRSATTVATPSASAETWLESASKSLERRDYEVAVTQYERTLELLKGRPTSDPNQLAAREGLALALEGAGQLEKAHAAWSEIDDPKAPEKLSTLSRQLCENGQATLSDAIELLNAGDAKGAEAKAKEAYRLFSEYGGSPEQQASALEQVARAYLAENRSVLAETELKRAQRLVFSQERQSLLATISTAVRTRPAQRRRGTLKTGSPATRPRLQLDSGNVPQAAKRARANPRLADKPNRPRRRMKEIPVYKRVPETDEPGEVPLGERDVLQTYRTNRPKNNSSIPGLR